MRYIEQNTYLLHNRVTGEKAETLAISTFNACEKVGWLFQDCFIRVKADKSKKERK